MDREKWVDVIYFQYDLHRPLSFAFAYMQVHPLTGQVLYANQAERFEAKHHLVYGESERVFSSEPRRGYSLFLAPHNLA